MTNDLEFEMQKVKPASIKVIGVGGGGGNAVNYMYNKGIKDVDFVLCNTDLQALSKSKVPVKIQLGESLTHGRGAGNNPDAGKNAAIENSEEISALLKEDTQMVFITAGMGGGTGTGAAPVIAQIAKDLNILTVAIVSMPFFFEGPNRITQAIKGLEELKKSVDSLVIVNNQKIIEIYGDLMFTEAFKKADDVLLTAVKGIAEIITVPGYVNVDFADVYNMMNDSGVALIGAGSATGENRASMAVEEALNSPLLNNADIKGAKNILLNIRTGTEQIKTSEFEDIFKNIQTLAGDQVNIIWGYINDEAVDAGLSITIIATGFDMDAIPNFNNTKKEEKVVELATEKFVSLGNSRRTPEIKENKTENVQSHNKVQMPTLFENEESQHVPSNETTTVNSSNNPSTDYYEKYKKSEDVSDYENTPAILKKTGGTFKPNVEVPNKLSHTVIKFGENGKPVFEQESPFISDNVD